MLLRKEKPMQESKPDKEITMDNNYQFRISIYKKVFGSVEGKLLLDFMERIYAPREPSFNPNPDYYMLGKYRVVQEIKTLLNKQQKKGKEDE